MTNSDDESTPGYPGPELGDEVATAPKRTVPKKNALDGVSDPKEIVTGAPGDDSAVRDLPQIATRFLVFHPFFTYFVHLAIRQSADGRKKAETRIAEFRVANSSFYKFCVIADLILMVLVASLAVAVATYSAYKTLVL